MSNSRSPLTDRLATRHSCKMEYGHGDHYAEMCDHARLMEERATDLKQLVCDMINGFEEGMRNCESDADEGVRGARKTYKAYCAILARARAVEEEGVTMHATEITEVVIANAATVQQALEALTHDPESDAWTYSRYRATLRKDGRFIAIVTPDGRNALSEDAEAELLHALNQPKL